jgi:hypothetical protein
MESAAIIYATFATLQWFRLFVEGTATDGRRNVSEGREWELRGGGVLRRAARAGR